MTDSDAALERAADDFRRRRGLLSADDMEAWLDRWGLSFDEWLGWLAGDRPADARRAAVIDSICSSPAAAQPLERARTPARTGPVRGVGEASAFPFVPAAGPRDCGAAALAAVCRFHGVDAGLETVRERTGTTSAGGASLGELVEGARDFGLEATAVKASRRRLDALALPAIAHVDGDHWVVLYRVAADAVDVSDPSRGRLRLSRAEFEARWTGFAILLAASRQAPTE